ncbi:hypothetical protein OIU78_020073 [Salix suchowensis]|nr:hypothetical protein OIU78_020073 [Salix suchowensis]
MGSQGGSFEEENPESLIGQGSLFSLTLDEVQDQLGNLGKPLGERVVTEPAPPQQQESAQWMQFQHPSVQKPPYQNNTVAGFMQGHPVQQSLPAAEAAYPDSQMNLSPSSLMGTSSDTHNPTRKRVAPGDVAEKTVERKQKRMIKNRESAARSRARRQAYTHELEIKVYHLEEENERLRRQKEAEVLPCAPPPEPKSQLRRTSSTPF